MVKGFNSREHAGAVLGARVEELKLLEPGSRILFEDAYQEILERRLEMSEDDLRRLARMLGAVGRVSEGGLVAAFYPSQPMPGFHRDVSAGGEPQTSLIESPLLFRRYELGLPVHDSALIPVHVGSTMLGMRDVVENITRGDGRLELELTSESALRDFGLDIYAYEGYVQQESLLDTESAQIP